MKTITREVERKLERQNSANEYLRIKNIERKEKFTSVSFTVSKYFAS